jgi:ATP phosphoribosyltransferase regulatory subunit HisZ
MKKSVQIYVQVDEVELKNIEAIQEQLEKLFEEYEYKRIQMTLQDTTLVKPPTR